MKPEDYNPSTQSGESLIEMISNANYHLGKWAAIDDMAKEFYKKSGEAFKDREDASAVVFRALGNKFSETARQLRNEYDEIHQPKSQMAWVEIAKRYNIHDLEND